MARHKSIYIKILCLVLMMCSVNAVACDLGEKKPQKPCIYISYQNAIAESFFGYTKGRELQAIRNYGGELSTRERVEMVLLYQALYLGGIELPRLVLDPFMDTNVPRALEAIASGRVLISAEPVWRDMAFDLAEQLYISDPILREGEFVVGLYTNKNNIKAMSSQSLEDFSKLTIVTNKSWKGDYDLIRSLNFKEVYNSTNYQLMQRMFMSQRVDVMLSPFIARKDLALTEEDIYQASSSVRLYPIPRVRLKISDTRHFVVSRQHPQGKEVITALNRGLAILREKGLIEKAYTESGFFNEQTKDWPLLNP